MRETGIAKKSYPKKERKGFKTLTSRFYGMGIEVNT